MAEPGEGATGWAFGSQTCRGNIPAFAPKPRRIRIPAARSRPGEAALGSGAAKAPAEEAFVKAAADEPPAGASARILSIAAGSSEKVSVPAAE